MAKMRIGFIVLLLAFAWNSTFGQNILRENVEFSYLSQIGVREVGNNTGPQVDLYLASTNLAPGYAWCAAFVAWVLTENGVPNPKSAWSPSWFPKNKVVWQSNGLKNQMPLPGDVFGIYFSNLNRIAHVGFVHRFGNQITITVEGNTNDNGSREGDGVYIKRRPTRQIHSVARYIND
jgi:hypothetical protein